MIGYRHFSKTNISGIIGIHCSRTCLSYLPKVVLCRNLFITNPDTAIITGYCRSLRDTKSIPMKLNRLNDKESIFSYVEKKDLLLYYPYHSFDHFIHFLYEAVHNPETREIMVTQYRVAENSAVINSKPVSMKRTTSPLPK